MTVTLKEVAARAGVSRSAVSRTFTDGASVSASTRIKVIKAANDLGYRPSLIARGLATKRTKLVGLVADNYQNPLFLEVFDLFTQALQARGLRPLLVNLANQTDPENSVEMLLQYNVDGVIVATSTLPVSFTRALRATRIPVVHAFGRFERRSNIHVVGIDNRACGEMAAQTLLDHGYQRIALLAGPKTATSAQDRAEGFLDLLGARGIKPAKIRYAAAYHYQAGFNGMADILEAEDIDVVFCGDDLICMGAVDAARQSGRTIPDDIGFLGFNDLAMASWKAYNLTTIQQPTHKIINSSIELVTDLINNPARSTAALLFPCTVIERQTLRRM